MQSSGVTDYIMKLLVRTVSLEALKGQLRCIFGLGADDIVIASTQYAGITLFNIDENAISTPGSIRNIEALLLDEADASEFLLPTTAKQETKFESLKRVDELEQYEHLKQLIYIRKAKKVQR